MQLAIFDLDGTIVDSVPYWVKTDLGVLSKLGIEPTRELQNVFTTMTVRNVCSYLATNYNLGKNADEIYKIFYDILYNFYKYDIPAKQGAFEFVKKLYDQNIRLIVATSSERAFVEASLERLGMLKFFSHIITSDEVGVGKSRPDIFIRATELFGVSRQNAVVFEDSLYAIKTAKSAGFKVAGVYDEFSKNDQEQIIALCDYYYKTF